MTLASFVFTELANAMKYGGGVLYNLVMLCLATATHDFKWLKITCAYAIEVTT